MCLLLAAGWDGASGAIRVETSANAAETWTPSAASVTLRHFKHDRWTRDDGAPVMIQNIIQTPDGFLWLGSTDGLWRFDGLSFERVSAPHGSLQENAGVTALTLSSKGELWVGFGGNAGVGVYRGGRLIDMGMPNPPRQVIGLLENSNGAMWAFWGGGGHRMWRFNTRWDVIDDAVQLPPGQIVSSARSGNGSLWAAVWNPEKADAGLGVLRPGARRFTWLGGAYEHPRLSVDRHGGLWVADRKGVRKIEAAGGKPVEIGRVYPPIADSRLPRLAFDRFGGIWAATGINGVARIARNAGGVAERFTIADGLASHAPFSAFVDREGSIWIGGDGGLDRFRFANVTMDRSVPVDTLKGIALASADDGTVYVMSNRALYQIAPGRAPVERLKGLDTDVLCRGNRGSVLLVQRGKIIAFGPQGRRDVSDAPKALAAECAVDGSDRLWVTLENGSNWWRDTRGWHQASRGSPDDLGNVLATNRGVIAMQYDRDTIGVVSGDRLRRYPVGRFGFGSASSIDAAGAGFIITMPRGIVLLQDGRMRALDAARYPWLARQRTVLSVPGGESWLYRQGVSRVSTAALERAFAEPSRHLNRRVFDFRDGLIASPQHPAFSGPQAVSGSDGRIWIATDGGLAVIDSTRIVENPVPPPVKVSGLAVPGAFYRDPANLVLPKGTSSVRISYVALSLAVPQRVRVQYRLGGVDDDWVDAGLRRDVDYSNLGPGLYRFQVRAANDAGVWNRHGAALDFTIPPTFTQSLLFKLLCGAIAVAALWGFYRLRLRAVADQIRLRMAERLDERERIARELHDTLLRSVQSLILRIHLTTTTMSPQAPERGALADALREAEQTVAEGRRRVLGMRPRTTDGIEQMLRDILQAQAFEDGVTRQVSITGTPRPLTADAIDQIEGIAQEALVNMMRHARATTVEIRLAFHAQILAVHFRDDGVGIDPFILRDGTRYGHFGLIGMRERVRKLNGELILDAAPGGGTEVTIVIPAASAYADASLRLRLVSAIKRWRNRCAKGR